MKKEIIKTKGGTPLKSIAFICLSCVLSAGVLGVGIGFGVSAANRLFFKNSASDEPKFSYQVQGASELPRESVISNVSTESAKYENFADIVEDLESSVAYIKLPIEENPDALADVEINGIGSGIIFDEDNERVYILTNNHVIQNYENLLISIKDSEFIQTSIVGRIPKEDICVLSILKTDIAEKAVSYKLAVFGDSSKSRAGDVVLALGNSMGHGYTATMGIISAKDRIFESGGMRLKVMQVDAAINGGVSGGALVNLNGEVIGLVTSKIAKTAIEGVGYGIGTEIFLPLMEDIMNGTAAPILGVIGNEIGEASAEMLGLPTTGGVFVNDLVKNSNAEKSGIKLDDLIQSVQGQPVKNLQELNDAISKFKIGQSVEVKLYRRHEGPKTIKVTLGA